MRCIKQFSLGFVKFGATNGTTFSGLMTCEFTDLRRFLSWVYLVYDVFTHSAWTGVVILRGRVSGLVRRYSLGS